MKADTAIAIIPARFGSTRFPGKPLVATDDRRIVDAVRRFGGTAIMTRQDHSTGTDRLAEAAETLPPDALVVNVQGDEPMIEPDVIDQAIAAAWTGDAEMGTIMTKLD